MDEEKFLTISEIAERIGVPENSARRYAKLFKDFLPKKVLGRVKKYSPDSLDVIFEISEMYKKGYDTEGIFEKLQDKRNRIFEVESNGKQQPPSTTTAARNTRDLEIYTQAIKDLSVSFKDIATALERSAQKNEVINELLVRLREVEEREAWMREKAERLEKEIQWITKEWFKKRTPWWRRLF
ncbi:MAG: MerR family transcriptional regulator [bacterium]